MARHKSKRDVEQLVARIRPQPDVPSVVRKLPTSASIPRSDVAIPVSVRHASTPDERMPNSAPAAAACAAPPPPEIKPLAPERYKVQFTVSRETHDKLRRAQDLLRHTIPDGDPAAIFDRALTLLLAELSRTKLGATDRPRTEGAIAPRHSRHIPSAVKRSVWTRDGGQCAFRGERGRCAETGFLEFHHVVPYADGGEVPRRISSCGVALITNTKPICGVEQRCRSRHAKAAHCLAPSELGPGLRRVTFTVQ